MRLLVVVPFLNEQAHMPAFLASLAIQRRPPERLVLVDDGSTDESAEMAKQFARSQRWASVLIRPPRSPERDRLAFAKELVAFQWAVAQIDEPWDVVAKLDADLRLSPSCLERIELEFAADPSLGLAGPYLAEADSAGTLARRRCPAGHVDGAAAFYRRACYEQITPLPTMLGWDTMDEVRARMHGWTTRSFELRDGDCEDLRPMGSYDGLLRGYRRAGRAAWAYGSPPLVVGLAGMARMRDRPPVLAGLSFLWGWVAAALQGAPRAGPAERRWVRDEQHRRVRRLLSPRAPAPLAPGAAPHVVVLLENQAYPYDPRVRAQVEALLEWGYEVTVLGPTGTGHEALEEQLDGVRVLRFVEPPSGRGIRHYIAEFGLSFVRLRRLVRRVARERRIDAVLVCNPPDFLVELARPLARHGAGVVLDDRELSPELFEVKYDRRGPLYALLLAIERRAFRQADAVLVTNGGYIENVTKRAGLAQERVFVVGNGPDPRRIHPVAPRPELRGGREHLVLWMGAMSTQEGLNLLVEAADELVNRRGRQDVAFALVGPGDVHDQLGEEIRRRRLEEAVTLPGRVGDDLVRAYLSTADVCVNTDQPNRMNDRAAMRKVLEYMAVGRPVVQFPLTEMRRLCGDTTLWATPGDAASLADRIAELLDDRELRDRIGEAGRARVHDGLMWPDQLASLRAALDFARERGGRRAAGARPRTFREAGAEEQ